MFQSNVKAIKLTGILGIIAIISPFVNLPVVAQSTDRNNPTPITNRQITGYGGVNRTYFYSFTAQPGDLSVTMRSQCSSALGFGASSVLEDNTRGQLLDISPGAAYPDQPQSVTRNTNFSRTTSVIVRVEQYGGVEGCSYQIDFSGSAISQTPVSNTTTRSTTRPTTISSSRNLTGRWQGNDGGTYYIRQIGNRIWWLGEDSNGEAWSNVFHGSISGNRVSGDWADVPKGSMRQSGTLTLQFTAPDRLRAVSQTGGFGGTEWQKR
jgi:hypothetical protein